MSQYIIRGGKKLSGEIQVSGSKNAVLALMSACLLTKERCVLRNVPKIKDVEVLIEIIKDLGAEVEYTDHELAINAANLKNAPPDEVLVGKLRASVLLLGPLLSRFQHVSMKLPGGDRIGARAIDVHLDIFKQLGAQVSITAQEVSISTRGLSGTIIVLPESSVTATENAILSSVLASGQTVIKLAAMEPHVQQLAEFLNLMGAKISGAGTTTITVEGVPSLHGAEIEIIPDSNEAASLLILAASTKSEVRISRLNPEFMEDFLLKLHKMGVEFERGTDYIQVLPPKQAYQGSKIQCGLYPKLASDDMPPFAVLATQAAGETVIYEWLYENRLGHIPELQKMGANAEILDPHRVKILGPTKLYGRAINSYDLRMGMTLVIAALVAAGQSEIEGVEHIDRGYENLEQRLANLGANIKRVG